MGSLQRSIMKYILILLLGKLLAQNVEVDIKKPPEILDHGNLLKYFDVFGFRHVEDLNRYELNDATVDMAKLLFDIFGFKFYYHPENDEFILTKNDLKYFAKFDLSPFESIVFEGKPLELIKSVIIGSNDDYLNITRHLTSCDEISPLIGKRITQKLFKKLGFPQFYNIDACRFNLEITNYNGPSKPIHNKMRIEFKNGYLVWKTTYQIFDGFLPSKIEDGEYWDGIKIKFGFNRGKPVLKIVDFNDKTLVLIFPHKAGELVKKLVHGIDNLNVSQKLRLLAYPDFVLRKLKNYDMGVRIVHPGMNGLFLKFWRPIEQYIYGGSGFVRTQIKIFVELLLNDSKAKNLIVSLF